MGAFLAGVGGCGEGGGGGRGGVVEGVGGCAVGVLRGLLAVLGEVGVYVAEGESAWGVKVLVLMDEGGCCELRLMCGGLSDGKCDV